MPPLEIIGADEIVGEDLLDDYIGDDDDDDIDALLGAAPRRGNRRAMFNRARIQAAAVHAARGAAAVRTERPTEARELPIGFFFPAVAAGATETVTTRPQVLFRPTRLVVPSAVAPSFSIEDIKVGNKSQFIAAGPVPAEAFAQTAFNTPLKCDTCQISMDLIVEVENVSVAPADFRAVMFGNAVY